MESLKSGFKHTHNNCPFRETGKTSETINDMVMSKLKGSDTHIIEQQIKFNIIIENEINSSFKNLNLTCKIIPLHKPDIIIRLPDIAKQTRVIIQSE